MRGDAQRSERLIRRRRRIFFKALTVLSLVLAVFVAGLWVRSASRWSYMYGVGWSARCELIVISGEGGLYLLERDSANSVLHFNEIALANGTSRDWPLNRHFGFEWVYIGRDVRVRLPYWLVIVFPATLAAALLIHNGRRRTLAAGACATCGYDLRATPDRCPECGTDSRKEPL